MFELQTNPLKNFTMKVEARWIDCSRIWGARSCWMMHFLLWSNGSIHVKMHKNGIIYSNKWEEWAVNMGNSQSKASLVFMKQMNAISHQMMIISQLEILLALICLLRVIGVVKLLTDMMRGSCNYRTFERNAWILKGKDSFQSKTWPSLSTISSILTTEIEMCAWFTRDWRNWSSSVSWMWFRHSKWRN